MHIVNCEGEYLLFSCEVSSDVTVGIT